MPYLLDSNWVIYHLSAVPEAVQLLDRLAVEGIFISMVTYLEVFEGVETAPNPSEVQVQLARFTDDVPILPLSVEVARRCARLRAHLRREGRRVNNRALDLIIAATAIEHDLTLVTRNLADFNDIPQLRIYQPS